MIISSMLPTHFCMLPTHFLLHSLSSYFLPLWIRISFWYPLLPHCLNTTAQMTNMYNENCRRKQNMASTLVGFKSNPSGTSKNWQRNSYQIYHYWMLWKPDKTLWNVKKYENVWEWKYWKVIKKHSYFNEMNSFLLVQISNIIFYCVSKWKL